MIQDEDINLLVQACEQKLNLKLIDMNREYGYSHLPLCVIDAVFSMGVRYASTRNTVARFCDFFTVTTPGHNKIQLTPKDQLSISQFISFYDQYGVDGMTEKVYQNRQRTSTQSGILKSEAVLHFSQQLARFDVEYLQDVNKVLLNPTFEAEITHIPGQRSGISLRYFYMLVGSENFVKPDRMIERFVLQATGKTFGVEETTELITEVCAILAKSYMGLTPRTLDNEIWQYQRNQ